MPQPFFPESVALAWAFYAVLVGITLIATYTDLRYLQIPKWLTLPALASGVLVNVILGAITDGPRGSEHPFLFGGEGGFLGALDGLLLALSGCGIGFGLFLVMFVLGTCRGGDVKLFAAVGAWVGPKLILFLLGGTIVAVVFMAVARLAWNAATHGLRATYKDYTLKGAPSPRKKSAEPKTTRRRLTAYSPAVALSAALVLLWMLGVELHLRAPKERRGAMTNLASRVVSAPGKLGALTRPRSRT
jgi:prepilin peptidase CpaA